MGRSRREMFRRAICTLRKGGMLIIVGYKCHKWVTENGKRRKAGSIDYIEKMLLLTREEVWEKFGLEYRPPVDVDDYIGLQVFILDYVGAARILNTIKKSRLLGRTSWKSSEWWHCGWWSDCQILCLI